MDPQVIHVDLEPVFGNHVSEDMIHECLKGWWGITEAKEHNSRFEKAKRSDECHFPLVFFPNVDVIIAPLNVKLSE